MTSHDDLRLSLGSYLTGALGPTERAEIDDHLQHCDSCRGELVELAALPGLLGRLDRTQLAVEPPDSSLFGHHLNDSDPTSGPTNGPPDALLNGLLTQARRIEDASRRRLRRLRAAAAATTVAAIVAAAFATAPVLAPTPTAGTSYQLRPGAASTRLTGQVTLVRKPWGTELALSLRGLPPREACVAVVTGIDGQRAAIGNWSATPDHVARVDLASDIPPAQLASLTVETVAGTPLLGVVLSPPSS